MVKWHDIHEPRMGMQNFDKKPMVTNVSQRIQDCKPTKSSKIDENWVGKTALFINSWGISQFLNYHGPLHLISYH
jgi:hypothetical protein